MCACMHACVCVCVCVCVCKNIILQTHEGQGDFEAGDPQGEGEGGWEEASEGQVEGGSKREEQEEGGEEVDVEEGDTQAEVAEVVGKSS